MPEYGSSSISTFDFNDLQKSVDNVPNNKILLDNLSKIYDYNNGEMKLPMNFLKKYENILKSNLSDFSLPKSQYYRPEYVSYELFGTTDLWYLILFVNDMYSPMQLCKDIIKVPSSTDIIEVLIQFFNNDRSIERSHREPIEVKRHFLKDINFASDNILNIEKTMRTKYNNLMDTPENNHIDEIFSKADFWIDSIIFLKNNSYDSNGNNYTFDTSNRFGLPLNIDNINAISLPTKHELVKNGFISDVYYTNKYLKKDVKYALVKRYNGESIITVENIIDPTVTTILNKRLSTSPKVTFNRSIMNYDLREASLINENYNPNHSDEIWMFKSDIENVEEEILFDNNLGLYKLSRSFELQKDENDEDNKFKCSLPTLKCNLPIDLETNDIDLSDFSFLGISCGYNIHIEDIDVSNYDLIEFSPINIKVWYLPDGKEDKEENYLYFSYSYTLNNFSNYDTNNLSSYIKRIIPTISTKDTHLDIKYITLDFDIVVDMTELNTLNLTYEIFDINFYGFLYDEIVEEFSMSVDTNSFKISYDYDYDKSLKGFYFEPYITEVIDNFSELFSDSNNNTDEVKDFKVETLHVDNVIKDDNTSSWFTNCFSNEKISKLTSFYIDNKDLKLPDSYSFEFVIRNYDSNISGGVLISIESFDRNTGYVFAITNDATKNKVVSEEGNEETRLVVDQRYHQDENGKYYINDNHFFIPTGCYKFINKGFHETYIYENYKGYNYKYNSIKIKDNDLDNVLMNTSNLDIDNKIPFNDIAIKICRNKNEISFLYHIRQSNETIEDLIIRNDLDYKLMASYTDFRDIFKNGSFRITNLFNNRGIWLNFKKIIY